MDLNWIRAGILATLVGEEVGVALYQRYVEDARAKVSVKA